MIAFAPEALIDSSASEMATDLPVPIAPDTIVFRTSLPFSSGTPAKVTQLAVPAFCICLLTAAGSANTEPRIISSSPTFFPNFRQDQLVMRNRATPHTMEKRIVIHNFFLIEVHSGVVISSSLSDGISYVLVLSPRSSSTLTLSDGWALETL